MVYIVVICMFVIFFAISYVNDNYNTISNILEQILSKKDEFTISDTKDNRKSKLIHQSKKIIKMLQIERNNTDSEKTVIKQLISDISHQLRTPFANIKMYTELLEREDLSFEEINNYVHEIKKQNEKMEWMIESLLKSSRLETGAIEFIPEPLNIKQTIADSVSSMYSQLDKKDIEISVVDFEDLDVLHNRKWTVEVLNNILENAIKYSRNNSTINISVNQMDLYTRINIEDTGIGIKKEDYSLIFNRFYRGENVSGYNGAGIGLFLSSSIMSKQGGYITVKSEMDKGSTFSICLQNII